MFVVIAAARIVTIVVASEMTCSHRVIVFASLESFRHEDACRPARGTFRDFAESLTALARDLRATWAADAVAGSLTGTLAACMPQDSTIAVYGVLSGSERG